MMGFSRNRILIVALFRNIVNGIRLFKAEYMGDRLF